MGTRADFYVGRGKDAEWIGSVAFDGYPDGFERDDLFSAKVKTNSVRPYQPKSVAAMMAQRLIWVGPGLGMIAIQPIMLMLLMAERCTVHAANIGLTLGLHLLAMATKNNQPTIRR